MFIFNRPRQLPINGADFENVCILRTPDDANKIAEAAKGKKVVIIGSSFIGRYFCIGNINMTTKIFLQTYKNHKNKKILTNSANL